MLNRHNLNIAKLASKEESRFTLSAIRVTPVETVVTDGRVLVRVSNPTMPVEQFPALPGATITDDFNPFNLPAAAALQLAKSFKKRCTIPVLGCAAVDTGGELAHVVTTDLENVTRCEVNGRIVFRTSNASFLKMMRWRSKSASIRFC